MIIRSICEAYFKTPAEIEDMTMDQIAILGIEKGLLQSLGGIVVGTPESLYAKGILKQRPYPDGLSLVMRLKKQTSESDDRQSKRKRKEERKQQILAQRKLEEST